jgi:uncharacterized protein
MIAELNQIVGFDWDEANSLKSSEKHSVTQAEAEQIFADRQLKIADDVKHRQNETRYHAMGRTFEGRHLHVTFTLRENQTKLRVISARNMNRKERAIYEQET